MTTDLQHRARVYEISHRLATMLGQAAPDAPTFVLQSRSRRGVEYPMVVTPEGIAVHVGDGCEGELFNGPIKCWHSKEGSKVMTSLTPYQAPSSPVEIRFNEEQMKVIKSTICKGATDEELQLFVATCTRTGLDPFLKQIYAVKRWDSKEKREVMAIQVGIDGLRLVADRTTKYGGQDPIEWLDTDGVWSEVWTGNGEHPVAARTAVYRKDWSRKAPAVCRWDSYVQTFNSSGEAKLMPNWAKMPDVMLGKCAEALALRRAFPAEMSGVAAQVGYDYDPEAEADYQQRAVDLAARETGRAEAIEGEVIKHEAPQPGLAQDNPAFDEDGAADVALATDEQLAAIADWSDQIKQSDDGAPRLKAVDATRRERWAYAVDTAANRFMAAKLTSEHADAYIALLRETHEGKTVATQEALV